MPVIYARERATYISDGETDPAIRQEVGSWFDLTSTQFTNGKMRITNDGGAYVIYRFTARRFSLMAAVSGVGFSEGVDITINGVAVTPPPTQHVDNPNFPGNPEGTPSWPWFTSPDYGREIAIEVKLANSPTRGRYVFDNGVKLVF